MMQKSTAFTTILRVKKCHFHYDMQKIKLICWSSFRKAQRERKYLHYSKLLASI
jgi:hypothetical protein